MKVFTKIIKYLWMYCIKGVMNYQFNKFYVQILCSLYCTIFQKQIKIQRYFQFIWERMSKLLTVYFQFIDLVNEILETLIKQKFICGNDTALHRSLSSHSHTLSLSLSLTPSLSLYLYLYLSFLTSETQFQSKKLKFCYKLFK